VDKIVSKNPKTNAHKKPSILIPETKWSAKRIIKTFITRRKSPKVIIVIGRVRIIIKGFTIAFKKASTNANIMAVVNDLSTTCGCKSFEIIYTAIAVIIKLIKNLISIFLKATLYYH
jgi:hypothetical protein